MNDQTTTTTHNLGGLGSGQGFGHGFGHDQGQQHGFGHGLGFGNKTHGGFSGNLLFNLEAFNFFFFLDWR